MLEIRPSKLEQLSLCPGSALMQAHVREMVPGLREVTQTAEASVGTDGHQIVAHVIRECFQTNLCSVESAMETALAQFTLDGWTVSCIWRCVEFAKAMIDQFKIAPEDILVEHHLDGMDLGMQNGGTADLVLVVPFDRVIVIDWKLGFIEQDEAVDHDQLAGYAVMAAATFKVEKVEVVIYQARMEESVRASRATFDHETLKNAEAWTRQVASDAQDPDAEVDPSFRACQHCDALPFCKAAKEYVMRARDLLEGAVPQTPGEWGELASAVQLAGKINEKGKALVKDHIANGGVADGWIVSDPTVTKDLEDAFAVYTALASAGSPDLFWKAAKVSRAQLDKVASHGLRKAYEHLVVENEKAGSLKESK